MTTEQFIQETIAYYSADPVKRRCFTYHEPSATRTCAYSPHTVNKIGESAGCAIGRNLTESAALEIDKMYLNAGVNTVMERCPELFPKWMLKMDHSLLRSIQYIHDIDSYWTTNGLSQLGIVAVNDLIKDFNLSIPEYK